ncbi:MAG: uroporphyrinogen-III synthase [Rhabdochlamydiaceae bacterium]|jgi:uroporphyrinogen-III synthase
MILYLGTDPSHFVGVGPVVHYPVIKLVPKAIPPYIFEEIPSYTHCIFTSKNAVSILKQQLSLKVLEKKTIIAVGVVTKARLEEEGLVVAAVAQQERQEGVVELLKSMSIEKAHIFLPHSLRARDVLERFLIDHQIQHRICDLYDTVTQKLEPLPDLRMIETIVFTSPSTVEAFFEIFSFLPPEKRTICIGPITQEALNTYLTRKGSRFILGNHQEGDV